MIEEQRRNDGGTLSSLRTSGLVWVTRTSAGLKRKKNVCGLDVKVLHKIKKFWLLF